MLFSYPAEDYGRNERLKPEVLARLGIQRNIRGAQPLSRMSRDLSRFQSRAFSVSRLS
jgi:hypothetical protein